MKVINSAILGFSAAVVFSLLYISGIYNSFEDRIYDIFLYFRSNRQKIENVIFLDVDDRAIAYNGFYPWPRSIPADGLLRLKEYGVKAAIFDIEYIDRGPQGVDSLYLNQGLGNDFSRSFSEISLAAQELFSAISTGRIPLSDVNDVARTFSGIIHHEHQYLYDRAQTIARDNDLYLAQAKALLGKSWSTLNLQEHPLAGEQAERSPIAEKHFSYPVNAAGNAHLGGGFIDILPALPVFAQASRGAGFTNVEIDEDGVRRRVYLAQNIQDHWYLQLSFAPLINSMSNPEIVLERKKMTIKQAEFPDGRIKDIVIPLDQRGRMMLDWPKEDYIYSYEHISFAQFSLLDDIEAELEKYSLALSTAAFSLFDQFDSSLQRIPIIIGDLEYCFEAAHTMMNHALEYSSDEYFDAYIEYRNLCYSLIEEILAMDADKKVQDLSLLLCEEYPESADVIQEEADYISILIYTLKANLDRWYILTESNDKAIRDKFCIIGRVDTGTTDYGANPFYGKYVNVGTHGVVLDTILSESFIIPLSALWRILFMIILIPAFFIISNRLTPVYRLITGFSVLLIFITGVVLIFRFTGIYFGPLGIILAMLIAIITREIISYAGSEKEKQFIRTAFSTYVSHDVVKEIISDPSRLQLGGTKRHMTAIFTDVKAFSTISEQLSPEDLVSLLNRYLSAMSDIVLAEKGTIDKYEGDAIIAFFGAPLELKDHALRACISAINMKKAEDELNQFVVKNNMSPMPLLTRIGINTGDMVAGNMGTENKMNYTIMGNAVNLAARLEGVNKQYGTWILASEDTVREAGDSLLTRKLDRVRVVGINEPVRLHEILDIVENADE
jgi:adenylate cyclase